MDGRSYSETFYHDQNVELTHHHYTSKISTVQSNGMYAILAFWNRGRGAYNCSRPVMCCLNFSTIVGRYGYYATNGWSKGESNCVHKFFGGAKDV